jgi:hypothetical protein
VLEQAMPSPIANLGYHPAIIPFVAQSRGWELRKWEMKTSDLSRRKPTVMNCRWIAQLLIMDADLRLEN